MYQKFLLIFFIILQILHPQFVVSQESTNIRQIPVTSQSQAELLNLGSNVNSVYNEYTPFITPDENYLFYQADRPGGIGQTGSYDLWFSVNSAGSGNIPSYTVPVNLGEPVNTPGFEGLPSLRRMSDNDYELYFTSYAEQDRTGPKESNIYYTRQTNKIWSVPTPVSVINSDFHDRMPSISPDGRYLFFSSDRPGGFGKDDIWMSEYDAENRRWKPPVNLGDSINTPASEITPSIHTDGITLYFSSNKRDGMGSYDIYVTQRLNPVDNRPNWKTPENLGTPYNTEQDDEYPTVTRSGEFMYFSSNRPGGMGAYDIYRARVPDFAKPAVIVAFKGHVFEYNTTKGIEATISVKGNDRRFDISSSLPDGIFKADFLNNKIYDLTISAPGYEPFTYSLDLRSSHENSTLTHDFPLKRLSHSVRTWNLVLQFTDNEGKEVAARAIYKFSDDKQMRKAENNSILLDVPRSAVLWNSFLERNSLILAAEAEGFETKEVDIPMLNLMENRDFNKENVIVIPIEMARLSDSENTGETIENQTKINGKITLVETIYFETDIADAISAKENKKLTLVLDMLKKQGNLIELHGHTDKRGSLEKNIKLSNNRSKYIKNLLLKMGILSEKIATFGHNYSRPAFKEVNEEARKKNRRVEIFIKKPANPDMQNSPTRNKNHE